MEKTSPEKVAMSDPRESENGESLTIRRLIPATPEQVFRAWTNPGALKEWWGPKDVNCLSAEVDLRVGGRYKIANELPDGSVLLIGGEFEAIERPHHLIYTWTVDTESPTVERVSVRFEEHDRGTMIVLRHDRIPTAVLSKQHEQGWFGCLDGLTDFLSESSISPSNTPPI